MKKLFLALTFLATLFITSCGNSVRENYLNGDLFQKWEFDRVEPYKIGSQGEENRSNDFMSRLEVTPMELDLTKGEEGTFTAFFPDMNDDNYIARDFSGEVDFNVKDNRVVINFDHVECSYDAKLPMSLNVLELSADEMMFELNGNGVLHLVYMKPKK